VIRASRVPATRDQRRSRAGSRIVSASVIGGQLRKRGGRFPCDALSAPRGARVSLQGFRPPLLLERRNARKVARFGGRTATARTAPAHRPHGHLIRRGRPPVVPRGVRVSADRTSAGAGFPDAPATPCLNLATHACPLGFRPPLFSGTSRRPEACEVV
jgi:hypothetical protein